MTWRSLEETRDIFRSLHVHDVVTRTTLIVPYSKHGRGEEAPQCLLEHGTNKKGKDFHNDVVMKGFDLDSCIDTILAPKSLQFFMYNMYSNPKTKYRTL